MNNTGRSRSVAAVLLCLLLAVAPGIANAVPAHIIALRIGDPVMQVDGRDTAIDAEGTTPVIIEGRALLPVRAIVETLGGTVTWDAVHRVVSIIVGIVRLELIVGKAGATVNGVPVPIDADNPRVVPLIIKSRTMVPVRFVAERLGAAVTWASETRLVTLTFGLPSPQPPATPLLLAPADGSSSADTAPVLIWAPVKGAETYRVTIMRGRDVILDRGGIVQSPWAIPAGMLTPGAYKWTVTATGVGGTSALQERPFTFTVTAPVLQPLAQTVEMHVTSAGWVPATLYVRAGAQVTWIIWGDQVTGCTDRIVVPGLGITHELVPGKNVVTFEAPSVTTIIPFACWMNMVKGTIIVGPD